VGHVVIEKPMLGVVTLVDDAGFNGLATDRGYRDHLSLSSAAAAQHVHG
jgi:hypothetical protein